MKKTLYVPEMHCEKCVSRIQNALCAAGIDGTVRLADKTVEVDAEKAAAAAETLDDLGFSAEER